MAENIKRERQSMMTSHNLKTKVLNKEEIDMLESYVGWFPVTKNDEMEHDH